MALPADLLRLSPRGRYQLSFPLSFILLICISVSVYSILAFREPAIGEVAIETDGAAALLQQRRRTQGMATAISKAADANVHTVSDMAEVEKALAEHWTWQSIDARENDIVTLSKPVNVQIRQRPVNILFGLCGNKTGFWSEVEVAFKSVVMNAPLENDLQIHFMVDEDAYKPSLEMLDRIDIRSWQTRNQITIFIYDVQSHVKTWNKRIRKTWHQYSRKRNVFRHSVGAYFRLFAKEVLHKEVEHVIYMDSDVVIMANLQELWKVSGAIKFFRLLLLSSSI